MGRLLIKMKVKLNINERVGLLYILPSQESYLTLNLISDLKKELSPTSKEIKEYKIVQEGSRIRWNNKGRKYFKEIQIGETLRRVIVDLLKKLDKEKRLGFEHLTLYEKFIEEEDRKQKGR